MHRLPGPAASWCVCATSDSARFWWHCVQSRSSSSFPRIAASRAARLAFLGIDQPNSRGFLAKTTPPPRSCGALNEPWRACPVPFWPSPFYSPESFVMVELKSIPPDAAMTLLGWYDRSTTLQKAGWAILLVLALATAVLMINRTAKYVRASRQNWLFISLANDLVTDQPAAALSVASNFTASPIARVVSASVRQAERDEFKLSTTARHFAITTLTVELTRGLATLGAIAMATPLLGAAVATDRLIYYLRGNISFELNAAVLQVWMADWLLCLFASLLLAFIATWGHRLLAAKANRSFHVEPAVAINGNAEIRTDCFPARFEKFANSREDGRIQVFGFFPRSIDVAIGSRISCLGFILYAIEDR